MDGVSLTVVLSWVANGLLTLVGVLIGFVVHLHMKADEETKKRFEGELALVRQRLHDFGNRISEVLVKQIRADDDRKAEEHRRNDEDRRK
jgi:uncharacterized membrane-anchored protein YhcB (DUF1043 family)